MNFCGLDEFGPAGLPASDDEVYRFSPRGQPRSETFSGEFPARGRSMS